MRLFGTITGTITRFDRAAWMTPPFDLRFSGGGDTFPGSATATASGFGSAEATKVGLGSAVVAKIGFGSATATPRTA